MKVSQAKQNIIETASHLFYKNGYNLTGINEIIAEAGVAKATLYSHFKSKDDICLAYLQYKQTTFLEDIQAFCRKRKPGKNQLLAIFDFLLLFFKDKAFNGCWCIRTVSEIPREKQFIRDEIQRQKNEFITLIKNLVIDNYPDKSTKAASLLARQIYLLYEGAVAESHLHQDKWPITESRQLCNQILN